MSVRSTTSYVLWSGAAEIHCYGRETGNALQLRGANAGEADRNNLGILERIKRLADRHNCSFFAPHPNRFNGEVVGSQEMIDRLDIHPADEWAEGSLYRGPHADGVRLDYPEQGFAVWSADCPTAVLHDPQSGTVVAAHCGFRSFFEWVPGDFRTGRAPVTASLFSALQKTALEKYGRRLDPRQVRGFVACGISSGIYGFHAGHTRYADDGMAAVHRWLRASYPDALIERASMGSNRWNVDLTELFRCQLEELYGVPRRVIGSDGVCTFFDRGPDDEPIWHSNRRAGAQAGRNLVLVIRR